MIQFVVDGTQLVTKARNSPNKALNALRFAVDLACLTIWDKAVDKVPKWEKTLASSLTYRVRKSKDDVVGMIGTPLNYGYYVEMGAAPHWVKASVKITKWFKDHGLTPWYEKGMWVRPRGSKNKRHFVPFDAAPALLAWYNTHKKGHPTEAVFFKKKVQPFLLPALKESESQIAGFLEKGIKMQVESLWNK